MLKDALTSAPVTGYSHFDMLFVVETDDSSTGSGGVFSQTTDGRLHPLQYATRTVKAAEKNYSTFEREVLAFFFALRKFSLYLLSDRLLELTTDHQALRHAFSKKDQHD